jgi:hypothetical protein
MTYESTAETITFIHGQASDEGDENKDVKIPEEETDGAPGEDDKLDEEEPTVE